ncbi:putative phage protein gp47/JayE [Agrobacterium vitis]|nr:putative phage protein gp47/JayE [Agrobacterium vitis]MBE1437087.1 putative phage protein gp47/JayE [Agrobacterium vitis]
MAWSIRSLADASSAIRGSFRRYMPGTDTALKNNFVTIVTKVLAAMAYEFELRVAWLSKQMLLSTSTNLAWVKLHAAEVGIYQKQASAATGIVTGTGAVNATYPAGIRFVSGSLIYVSTAATTSDNSGAISVNVVCQTKGAASKRDSGGILSLADPGLYPNLSTSWTVGADGLGGGADAEDIESLRERGLQRKRNPPGGGTLTDYERIVTDVSGVINAWAFRVPNSPGGIVVYFLFAGRTNNIPLPSDVAVVQAAIDAKRLIRVDDGVALAPLAFAIDVQIDGLDNDTADIRAGIKAAITAMYAKKCRPGIAGNTFTISRSWYSEAISTVTGEVRHRLVTPAADIVLTGGQFPVNGEFTYGA